MTTELAAVRNLTDALGLDRGKEALANLAIQARRQRPKVEAAIGHAERSNNTLTQVRHPLAFA